jgi:response regulator RpfG family c-di-GMP phosphodiesterase
LLERLFRSTYEVFTAPSASEALELLSVHDVALIISDQRMPSMTGLEFLKKAADMRPQTVRIILTGYTDASDLVDALNSGVIYKYITKPWVNEELMHTIKRALQHYETTKAQRQLQLQNERLRSRLKAAKDGFIDVVMRMLDMKVPFSREHAERVAKHASAVGEVLKMERSELEQLSLAALLHEAALYGIPGDIVLKETPFTPEESGVVRTEFEAGLQMLGSVPDLEEVVSVLRFQYEHFDGRGLPSGFSEEQIHEHARIIAIVDAYDNLTQPRCLRAALSHEEAVRLLRVEAGRRFDPNFVNIFCEVCTGTEITEEVLELFMV